jgi:hypothetical protein
VIPFTPKQDDPAENCLTLERLRAYYVAISVNPAIVDASPLVRDALVDRVIAGLRAAERLEDATDAKGREQCIALMRYDAEARLGRMAAGGW